MQQNIHHPIHPWHCLSCVEYGYVYKCNGCGEDGHGNGYRCGACNFDLHIACATGPPLLHHRFHMGDGHCFQFQTGPPGGVLKRCSACAQIVSGFGYHCTNRSCWCALHPSCALLPGSLTDPANSSQIFHLAQGLSSPCYVCGQQGPGWAYVTASGHYSFHVACGRSIFRDSRRTELVAAPPHPGRDDYQIIRHRPGRQHLRTVLRVCKFLFDITIAVLTGNPITMGGAVVGLFTN